VLINWLVKHVLRLFQMKHKEQQNSTALTSDELRIAVTETAGLIPDSHRDMLLSILDLEKVKIDDIMVPRSEFVGIDLTSDWDETLDQINKIPFTRIPIYSESIDNVIGTAQMI